MQLIWSPLSLSNAYSIVGVYIVDAGFTGSMEFTRKTKHPLFHLLAQGVFYQSIFKNLNVYLKATIIWSLQYLNILTQAFTLRRAIPPNRPRPLSINQAAAGTGMALTTTVAPV